jgi:hypothetical protein
MHGCLALPEHWSIRIGQGNLRCEQEIKTRVTDSSR